MRIIAIIGIKLTVKGLKTRSFTFARFSSIVFIEFFLFSQNLTKEQADYCVRKMVPYVDPKTGERVAGTLDYSKFVHELFVN